MDGVPKAATEAAKPSSAIRTSRARRVRIRTFSVFGSKMEGISDHCSLGYTRSLADTHGYLRLIGERTLDRSRIIFRNLDESILNELALHLRFLKCEFKR